VEEHTFNGFRYYASYRNEDLPKIEHNQETPEYLFKYYSFAGYNIDAIINSQLYASHPYELNDILDSSRFLFFSSQTLEFNLYQNLFRSIFESNSDLQEYYKQDIQNGCSEYISSIYNLLSDRYGVISVSGKENNPLMWPHYTQEKGFQIRFRSDDLIASIIGSLRSDEKFIGLFPMNYVSRIQPIDVSLFRRFDIPFIYSTNIKLDEWDYEQEWRLVVSKGRMGVPSLKLGFSGFEREDFNPKNRLIDYQSEIIDSVCLGLNFFSGTDFLIHWKGEKEIQVEPRKGGKNHDWYVKFLNFVIEVLSGKVYLSGVKYEMDLENIPYLIRTKERIEVKKVCETTFKILRTNEIIKLG
jgi:hypothetical protein